MYRIGIVTSTFDTDGTARDLFEAAARVAEAKVVDPLEFSVELDGRRAIKIGALDGTYFDSLVVRGLDFRGDTDFQFEIFEQLDKAGVIIVNSPAALQIAESKFLTSYILQAHGLPVPTGIIAQTMEYAEGFMSAHDDVIVKPIYGFQGYGVIRVKSSARSSRTQVKRILDEHKVIYLQEYIPNPGRDIRAFVVGGEVVASIYRLAPSGRWKTNLHAGAVPVVYELTDEQRVLAVRASSVLGLDYTGVDIIEGPDGDCVLEVNGAPAWGGIMQATGRDVAKDIVEHILRRLEGMHTACNRPNAI
ncbi:MAG: RimK family alpha-L-glutamate ligase [Candidatus Aquicultor sp.]|nr:RimK family alpha-L-glutamate ligase [Candidatus Aquicultor sp.]